MSEEKRSNRRIEAFARLADIMDELREKCPWDRKQTFESLRSLTIEETYELADAILSGDREALKEEIGDLTMHMLFYARIAEEEGAFDIADALHAVCDKLVKRHPHIYGNAQVANEADVKKNWEQLKLAEGKKSVLAGVPQSLPALVKAWRLQEKTAQVGFEWERVEDVWKKVEEELAELREAVANPQDKQRIEEELGDVFFALVNYARFLGIDPESALEKVNRKFKARFEYIEKHAPRALQDMSLQEMDALWNQAKECE